MSKTIVLFKGFSQYNVLRHFIDDFGRAFEEIGCDTAIVSFTADMTAAAVLAEIDRVIHQHDVYFLFNINGLLTGGFLADTDLYGNLPIFSFYVDNPMYHVSRLQAKFPDEVVSFISREHLDTCARLICQKPSVFIPHGGESSGTPPKPLRERSIPVLFAGSYEDPEDLRSRWSDDATVNAVIDATVQAAQSNPTVPLHHIVVHILKAIDQDVQTAGLALFAYILTSADRYLRAVFRNRVLT